MGIIFQSETNGYTKVMKNGRQIGAITSGGGGSGHQHFIECFFGYRSYNWEQTTPYLRDENDRSSEDHGIHCQIYYMSGYTEARKDAFVISCNNYWTNNIVSLLSGARSDFANDDEFNKYKAVMKNIFDTVRDNAIAMWRDDYGGVVVREIQSSAGEKGQTTRSEYWKVNINNGNFVSIEANIYTYSERGGQHTDAMQTFTYSGG